MHTKMQTTRVMVFIATLVFTRAAAWGSRGSFLARPGEADQMILVELEKLLGIGHRGATQPRMERLMELLGPTFSALPKNEHGSVGTAAARYALNRLFVQEHGWFVNGLQAANGTWSEDAPMDAMGGRVDDRARRLLEGPLAAEGFDLRELALFAAAIENAIHGETASVVRDIYQMLGKSIEDALLSFNETASVIDAYMASYIMGTNPADMTHDALMSEIEESHPTWEETQLFLREVQREVLHQNEDSVSFDRVAAVAEEAAARFGQWQSGECMAMKVQLVQMEDKPGSGRVRLGDFYHGALHGGKWQFSETAEYLRQLGSLDETDASAPRVIIPNYINSPSNCLASSSFYAVCCIDECGELLQRLERSIGSSHASHLEIIAAFKSLPPPSSAIPGDDWKLSDGLVRRLEEVATFHGGAFVPLYGRLFAQWLHHAYPRECPFPHLSGTTQPRRPDDYELQTEQESTASEEEMMRHMEEARARRSKDLDDNNPEDGLCSSMWTMQEELVLPQAHPRAKRMKASTLRSAFRIVAMVVAVSSLLLALQTVFRPAWIAQKEEWI
mmetsp:Transcript_62114/g.122819  ORF Transcript_62114/g.122819 Transcript_62114/m.122819 type:complete len:560 (-) Transcript_62114:42-1721(-)